MARRSTAVVFGANVEQSLTRYEQEDVQYTSGIDTIRERLKKKIKNFIKFS